PRLSFEKAQLFPRGQIPERHRGPFFSVLVPCAVAGEGQDFASRVKGECVSGEANGNGLKLLPTTTIPELPPPSISYQGDEPAIPAEGHLVNDFRPGVQDSIAALAEMIVVAPSEIAHVRRASFGVLQQLSA